MSLGDLAGLYRDIRDYAKAEALYLEALEISQKVLGQEHPYIATILNNLAFVYHSQGEDAKAEPLSRDALEISQKVLGPEHPDTASDLEGLALLEFDLGRTDEATALARQASAAELTLLSRILSFTSEQQRLTCLDVFHSYSLFPILEGH
jgi:tetratricopeptide (TPR) repeat protein